MIGTAFLGLGCKSAFSEIVPLALQKAPTADFSADSGMSYQQVFDFAFKSWYIRYMKGLQDEIGKERFLEMLQEVGWKSYEENTAARFRDLLDRDVESLITGFWEPMSKSRLWSQTIPVEIVEKSPSHGVVRMNDCLVATTFLEAEAADIGYAAICYADFAVAHAFNPKIKLTRDQCLMRGDGCCYFEYSLNEGE
jgi:hypothetical protein